MQAFADFAIVKPQVAFFEAYGSAGFAVLEQTIAGLQAAGVLVLADAKRGDIGSTMAAYAQAWAGESPLAADAVTASPYLGFESLRPLLDVAAAHGRGCSCWRRHRIPKARACSAPPRTGGPSRSPSSMRRVRRIAARQRVRSGW